MPEGGQAPALPWTGQLGARPRRVRTCSEARLRSQAYRGGVTGIFWQLALPHGQQPRPRRGSCAISVAWPTGAAPSESGSAVRPEGTARSQPRAARPVCRLAEVRAPQKTAPAAALLQARHQPQMLIGTRWGQIKNSFCHRNRRVPGVPLAARPRHSAAREPAGPLSSCSTLPSLQPLPRVTNRAGCLLPAYPGCRLSAAQLRAHPGRQGHQRAHGAE